MASKPTGGRAESVTIIALGVAWFLMYFAVRFYLEAHPDMARQGRLTLAFLPSPIFALFLWQFIKGIRGADELERKIQLEALAVAFPLGVLLITTLALVQRAVELNFQDWSYAHVWPYFVIFYVLGVAIARKRYT